MKVENWGLDTIELWAMVLTDLQITEKEFMLARRKSLGLTWLPTAPADFLELGREPIASQFPEIASAYRMAANKEYPHAVVFETAKRLGFWELRSQAENRTYPQWKKLYPQVCHEYSQGIGFIAPNQPNLSFNPQNGMLAAESKLLAPSAQIEIAKKALNKIKGITE